MHCPNPTLDRSDCHVQGGRRVRSAYEDKVGFMRMDFNDGSGVGLRRQGIEQGGGHHTFGGCREAEASTNKSAAATGGMGIHLQVDDVRIVESANCHTGMKDSDGAVPEPNFMQEALVKGCQPRAP